MRVLVLGGGGGMGSVTAATVADFDFVEEVVVTDLDPATAEKSADNVGPKGRGMALDVGDGAKLKGLIGGSDMVLNTVGPFYRFGVPVLRAAIDARRPYADIADDWQPTLDMLALDGDAREAGVTAIVGLGASPGISNMLALKAAGELDAVEALVTGWDTTDTLETSGVMQLAQSVPGSEGGPTSAPVPAALIHWLHQTSGSIRLRRGGQTVDERPLRRVRLDYPGLGSATTWTVGHPEPLTLTRSFPGLDFSANLMAGNEHLMGLLGRTAERMDSGVVSTEDAARGFLGELAELFSAQDLGTPAGVQLPRVFAVAVGRIGGEPTAVGAKVRGLPPGGMGGATGVPLALGAKLIAGESIGRAGVFAPEEVLDPDAFFDLLAPLSTDRGPFGTGAALVETSKAPASPDTLRFLPPETP